LLLNQAFGQLCTQSVELVRPMGGLADQDQPRVSGEVEQRVEVLY